MHASLVRVSTILVVAAAVLSESQDIMAKQCLIRGAEVTLDEVTIRPQQGESFQLDLAGTEVAARVPLQSGAEFGLEVTGALAFKASRKNLWLTVVANVTTSNGMVVLRRGSRLVNARTEHGSVVAAAVLNSGDMIEGEDKSASEMVSPVQLPCSKLALGAMQEDDDDEASDNPYADATVGPLDETDRQWWKPKAKPSRLRLYSRPSENAAFVDIRTPNCEGCLTVMQIDENGPWLRVVDEKEDVTVVGWTRRSLLEVDPHGGVSGGGCSGDHHSHLGGRHDRRQLLYDGPATVRAGTRVFADPPHGDWAVFRTDAQVRVRRYANGNWVELWEIPGIGSPGWLLSRSANVSLESVSFPPSNNTH